MTGGRRVLVTVNDLGLGGTQLNAVDFAVAVREHGFESVLVGCRDPWRPDDALIGIAAERGVPLRVFDAPASSIGGARRLTALARSVRADLVHAYSSWQLRPAFWGPHRLGRLPLVMTAYEMALPPGVYRSPALVVGTRYLLEDLADRPGATVLISPPVDTATDRPQPVDPGFWAVAGSRPGQLRVVVVSRLSEDMKAAGIEAAIHAVERLGRPDVDLVVVGSGDAEERLRRLGEAVDRRAGRRQVLFTGALADPAPAYAGADVVIGMGGSAARALAFGRPLVVVGDAAWSCRFDPDSAAALYRNSFWSDEVPDRPVDLLVGQLAGLLEDAALRRELGGFGRDFAVRSFGLPAMGEALAGVYRQALEQPRRPVRWLGDALRCDTRRLQVRVGARAA